MEVQDIPHTRGNSITFFSDYVQLKKESLQDLRLYDLSAGSGYIAELFYKLGSKVFAFDLFPDHNVYPHQRAQKIDLQTTFPIEDDSADIVILSETIEHLPNQYHFFKEASRILVSKGILILTTPNPSSFRSRFSQFVTESEHYSNPLPDETQAYVQWPGTNHGYFNKIFVSGVLRLRVLAALNGLKIKEIHKSQFTSTAFLFLFLYPVIWFFSWKNMNKQIKREPSNAHIFKEIFDINTSLKILLSKHLIIEFVKD